ncbi:MAG: hypothetical protein E7030_09440 [Akkermansiaceae bacterium]|nr:hypothetical protein [Akkermansiaceae bacterium]
MKYTAFTLMLAALVAAAPVQAQSSARGKKDAAAQTESKTGVRFVICSAANIKVKSPLWYKVSDEEADTVSISSRTATPRIKPMGGKVVFYEDNPIPPETDGKDKDGKAEKWKEPKVVFTVDTKGAASKAFCIVMPETETKVETIMLSESDFPKKGVHLINLSKKNVKISTSAKGDFSDAKVTLLKGGNTKSVNDSNKWSLVGANHGDQLAFQITYEGVKEQRARGTGGKTLKDANGKIRKEKVRTEITLRRSKFVVSERQSLISILVDDPARDGVKLLSIQLAD